jgi:predicted PurR-regulated permease PerM
VGLKQVAAMQLSTREFTKRAAIAVTLLFLPLIIWNLFNVILIATGAMLVAALLLLGSEPFVRWMRLPSTVALLLSGTIITGIAGGTGYLFGSELTANLRQVVEQAELGLEELQQALHGSELGQLFLAHIGNGSTSIVSLLTPVLNVSVDLLGARDAARFRRARPLSRAARIAAACDKRSIGRKHEIATAVLFDPEGDRARFLIAGT